VNFRIGPLTDADARELAAWQYEPPYDFYDFDADPDDLAALFDPARRERHRSVRDEDGSLVGFFYFGVAAGTVEVGLGLRPDLTGRGLGASFVEAQLAYARDVWAPKRFRLYVAAFNERARQVYERAGFREVGRQLRTFERFGEVEFLELERPA
jgi:RimJ/RimL family protein N-acetyltransferase